MSCWRLPKSEQDKVPWNSVRCVQIHQYRCSALSREAAPPLAPGTTCSMEQNADWNCLPACSLNANVKWQGCFGNKQSWILQPAFSFLAPSFSAAQNASGKENTTANASHLQCTHCLHLFCVCFLVQYCFI